MADISQEERNQLRDEDFGIPAKKLYPFRDPKHPDEAHDRKQIESAVTLFGKAKVSRAERSELARRILKRARELKMDTSGWKQILAFAQEQVPPMSDGTSLGNAPPRTMAPYYDEASEDIAQKLATASSQAAAQVTPTTEESITEDPLFSRIRSVKGAEDPFEFAKRIVEEIHAQVEKDSKPPTGNQNCQLCTWCAEARYRGINALPRPIYSPRDPALSIVGETIVANPVKQKIHNQRQVVETVRGAVDSRWYVHVNWKDSTGGHEFLMINIEDYAYIMDAQAGMLKELDETDSTNSYFRDINYANSYMVRLDTKKFNTELFMSTNDPSKVLPWKNSLDIPYMRDNGMLAPGADDDPRFRRVFVPSDEGLKYLKEDPELSQYWEDMHKATKGEFLVDRDTGEAIGHAFVHTNKKDKGFIFNVEVTPKYRRQGYGWILIDDAVQRFGGVDLTVRCDNEPAVHLYLQYGFEIYKKGVWFDPPNEEYWMKLKKELIPKPVQQESVTQEGAFQDLKNGVNPYSDDLVFHVSMDKHIDGQVWKPRVPDYLDPYNPEDTGFEDNTTPRICFSTSIEGALNGITVNLQRQSPDTFDKMYVYVPEKPWKEYKHKTNKQLVKDKLVYDANVTREVWIMEPVRMKLYGVIRVDQIADAKRKAVVPTSKGQKDTRNYFTYKWHWVVKPKVLKKATKFDYSPERVIDDLCVDVKKFKYGLIKDGRLMTGNVSDADYDKYWVFHSGEEVDRAGGGNCYDMVEYEAGYLEAFGVAYKKYFMNFTDTKNTKTINTHTICVVPHNGKFIYIEQAFKRVVDEWGYERKKEFDKLNDVFEYVAEVSAEYDNQDLNYGVWDYTDAEIDYGTPIKNFQDWIMTKCKMIHDGEASKPKSTKEYFNVSKYLDIPARFITESYSNTFDEYEESNTNVLSEEIYEECDMFIELGDSMFYVSEYHNALFDDPDAYNEAINEFGILLDSYGEELVQEVASYGPYDEYLKKHGYDPKTNTILDPKRPGKRVSAGRIGSEQERRRMNKFLIENGYDPKTETIQTDIDINVPIYMKATGNQKRDSNGNALDDKGNPIVQSTSRQKKRVKFMINPHEGAYATRRDGVHAISMAPKSMQQKAVQSNQTFKHEEGHINQYTNNDTPTKQSDVQRMNASTAYVSSLDKDKVQAAHDLSPREYDVDAYGAQHNVHDKKGTAAKSGLMSTAAQHKKTVSKFEKTIDSTAKKQGLREGTLEYQKKQIVDFLLKHPEHPGTDAGDLEWAEYLQKTYSTPEIFKTYIQAENKRDELNDLKKKRRAEIREFGAKNGTDNDAYSDLCDKWTAERKAYENEIEKLVATPGYSKAEDIIEDIMDMAGLSPDQLKTRSQELVDKGVAYNKSLLRHEKAYRDPEEMAYAHQKRGEFAQQQWNEQQKRQQAEQAKKRQLSKEQLQQQLASGQLSKEQAARATKKLARIKQFEEKKSKPTS